jgi:hypothetical protein
LRNGSDQVRSSSRTAVQQGIERGRGIAWLQLKLYRLASTFEGSAESGGAIPRRLTPIRWAAAMRWQIGALVFVFACASFPIQAHESRDTAPDLYESLFTQLTYSGFIVVGTWNPDPGNHELLVGIYGKLDTNETVVMLLKPEGKSFRQQLESFAPELKSSLESEYPNPRTIKVHGSLQSNFRYSSKILEPRDCPAVSEFRKMLDAVPLFPAARKASFSTSLHEYFFAIAQNDVWIDLRTPNSHPFAALLRPVLTRLAQCAS